MKKYYLCETYNQDELLNYLLKENNNQILENIEILSLKQFLDRHNFSYDVNIFKLNNHLKNLNLIRFKKVIDDYDFLNKIINYYHQLIKYDISITSLNLDLELKSILNLLNEYHYQNLMTFIENYDFKNFTIIPFNYDLFEFKIINKMLEKDAKLLNFKTNNQNQYFKALNKRKEIETIAFKIVNENLDLNNIALIICDLSYLNILKITFDRYQIPLNFKFSYLKDDICQKMSLLLNFYVNQDFQSYLKIINLNLLTKTSSDINEYLTQHLPKNFNLKNEFNYFKNLKNFNHQYYLDLENKANLIHSKYQELFNALALSYFDFILFCYEKLTTLYGHHQCQKLKSFIEKHYDDLKLENHQLIIKKLQNITLKNPNYHNALNVYKLNQQALFKQDIFVVGANQKNYPNFKILDGYFNEYSLTNTNYPSIEKLFERHFDNLKWLNHKNTTFSYAVSDYNGKNFELSTYLEHHKEIKIQDINFKFNDFKIKDNIKKEVAHQIFFKDGIFKTSISALELFCACPFYFLIKYGFKLYEENKIQLNPAFYGTLIHSIMQQSLSLKPLDYPLMPLSYFENKVQQEFEIIKNIYPNTLYFNTYINLISKHLVNTLKIMIDFQENNYLIPSEFEKKVNYQINDELEIVGIIDRIDYSKNYFRIIDYKTSKHHLDDKKFALGLQLQLHLYAMIMSKISDKKLAGTYYFNITNPKKTYHYFEYGKKDGFKKIDIENELAKLRVSLLNGKTYQYEGIYHNLKEINMLDAKNNPKKTSDFNFYQEKTMLILNAIINQIKNGDFKLQPIIEATHYNEYNLICHFKGRYRYGLPYFEIIKEKDDATKS